MERDADGAHGGRVARQGAEAPDVEVGQRPPEAWNQTGRDYPRDSCIHWLFEAQAARSPRAVALVWDDGEVSYAELNDRANRLAHLLRARGSGPGSYVGLCAEHGPDAIVGLLGILKSGAAYVPIDPAWPADRQRHILDSLGVAAVVTRSSHYRRLFDLGWELPLLATIVCLDVADAELPSEPLDTQEVQELWDLVTSGGDDEVTAAGFRHTEDGSPFTVEEVRQYQDHIVGLARELVGPRSSVLEIGSGSGLVLRALGRGVASYVGLDPSVKAQELNRAWATANSAPVQLVTDLAHNVAEAAPGTYDVVIVASTVQFFPGPAYLRQVLRQAAALCAPGGRILLGDLVDPASVEQRFGPSVSRTKRERELHLHPEQLREVVRDLEGILDVDIRVRHGFDNELACRYDAVLTVGDSWPEPSRLPRRLVTAADLATQPADDLDGGAGPEDLAYVIFTSGSTGTPKGVMVQHRPVVNLIDWVNTTFSVSAADRLLLVTSFCFDLSVYDVFGILAAGGSVRVVGEADLHEPRRLLALLCTEGITFWDSAPAALHQVMQFADLDRPGLPPDSLRLVFLSGDWVPVLLPDHLRAHFPGAEVVALGGATEAAIWSNFYPIGEVDPAWSSIPYGRPIQNARYYVLDEAGAQCPVGTTGDLYIGGECLAQGYAGDPGLTANKFLDDPFNPVPRATMYRTGDRARYWPDGNMEFLGRVDNQVKIRGFRVELGEIEAALARHPDVEIAVVVAAPGTGGDLQLDAYVLPAGTTVPDAREMRSHLEAMLPDHMIPQTYTTLSELPLSATGKLDRKNLPEPERATGTRLPAGGVADEVEAMLITIWADVLGVADIGLDDNFFSLGGQSLAATRVVARLSELWSVSLPLRTVLDSPTVRELASTVRKTLGASSDWGTIEPLVDRSEVPLSVLQEQMWEMEAGMPPGVWNESFHHRLPSPVDVEALTKALGWLVDRHEGLRTAYLTNGDGRPFQRVLPSVTLDLPQVTLSGVPAQEHDDEIERITAADNDAPFDPELPPLIRAQLVTFDDVRSELVVTFDHLVVDRTSVDILLTDLDDAYACFVRSEQPVAARPAVQYADFAAWERRWLGPDLLEERWEHWKRRLQDMPLDPQLPYDRNPEWPGAETTYVSFVLPSQVHGSLKRLAVVSQSSLFVVSLAVLKALLARRTGETDLVVGTQMGGRYHPEVEGTVGVFTGPALLRTDLSGDPTFETVVRRVRDGVQELLENQPFPYSRLRSTVLADEVERRGIPFWRAIDPIDVEFFYADPDRWSPGVNIVARPPRDRRPTSDDRPEFSQPLEFTLFTDGEQLWGKVTYRVDLFDDATIEGMVAELEHLFASAAENWLVRLSGFEQQPVAGVGERQP